MRYRLLIVDDEQFILDWLVGLFLIQQNDYISVLSARSAEEALDLMGKFRIDIVLSDIMMTGMNGMELCQKARMQWPDCKFIFLTAHDRFEYAYNAFGYGVVDYVLKTEKDDRIIAAVQKAIASIERERKSQLLLQKAGDRLNSMTPVLQDMLLKKVFSNNISDLECLQNRFRELDIQLDTKRKVFMLLVRIDNPTTLDITDISGAIKDFIYIDSIISRRLAPHFKAASFIREDICVENEHRIICALVQPVPGIEEKKALSYLKQQTEDLCSTIIAALNIHVTLCCALDMAGIDKLNNHYDVLRTLLVLHEDESGIIIYGDTSSKNNKLIIGNHIDTVANRFRQNLISGNEKQCLTLIHSLLSRDDSYETASQVYASLALIIEIIIKQFSINCEKPAEYSQFKQTTPSIEHLHYIVRQVCKSIADLRRQDEKTIVEKIREFVKANISGDLSLDTLADLLHYNPSYLSRLFHNNTGATISQYISAVKLAKIEELLLDHNLKIKDIGEMTGFESQSYFSRFFKKHTGISAQTWRDNHI